MPGLRCAPSSAKDDLRATMEAEFTKQFAALAARQNPETRRTDRQRPAADASGAAIPARNGETGSAESLAHLPPCRITHATR